MPLGRATAIVPPVIHVIWMADSSVLWPHSSSNQTVALKKQIRFFSESFHAPPDSFISKNEGMAKVSATFWRIRAIRRIDDDVVPGVEQFLRPPQRVLASPVGAKAVAVRRKVPFKDRFQHHEQCRLNRPVAYRWHGQCKLHTGSVRLWDRLR